MPSNQKEYMRNYMREYVELNNESLICDLCKGKYKKYNKSIHNKSKKHMICLELVKKKD